MPRSARAADDAGFRPIFDGKTLKGWDGDPRFWRVEDGTITGETTKKTPAEHNTFLIWRGGKTGDFELRLQYRLRNHNSGIQYRSFEVPGPKWVVGGYQADMEGGDTYSGILYGEKFRGILAQRGQKTVLNRTPAGKFLVKVVGSVGDRKKLQSYIKKNAWNDYRIVARGFHFRHEINGHVMSECTDNDRKMRRASGILALQLHAGPAMKVQFRNIRLKVLKPVKTSAHSKTRPVGTAAGKSGKKTIVFLAGRRSHGYGAHEHRAGCLLLAKALNQSKLPVHAVVVANGWPKDPAVLEHAASIVIYSDGGPRHPMIPHRAELDRLMKQGVGLVCLHYAVEVPKGPDGRALLNWIGGYFEPNWSVNPHWMADYKSLPHHPITRGVHPFSINDEWYYHMRFRTGLKNVTPILTAVPPRSTLSRPDGPHSGNPIVRALVAKGEPQHMAWAYQRPGGGRGFGFTGGHFHWNWAQHDFRTTVLNAIVWTAHVTVPRHGVPSKTPTLAELEANQDYPKPKNFDENRIRKMLADWNPAVDSTK